jgi:hypothetical protein
MPAILVGRQRDNAGAGDIENNPLVWRAGETVGVFEVTHRFGFMEMPINPQGSFSVAQVNAQDVTALPLYASVKMTDSGVITSGTGADVTVATSDIIVLQADDSWTNFGPRTDVPDGFFHIRISDKTKEEVNVYLESFNKKLTYQTDQYNPADDMRRWTSTNVRVSASGNNGFSEQGIADAIAQWNADHPDNTVTLVDTDNLTYFQVDGIMPTELYDEWQQNTQEQALADYYKRRRWYINQSGLDALANNAWVLNGTAADVNPFLRDGLLD